MRPVGARGDEACALRGKRCVLLPKKENPVSDAQPVSDAKMLPTGDDPGRWG